MGYDYLVKKGTKLIVSIGTGDTGKGHWHKEIEIPVKKGQEIYYEIYMKDGDLESR